MKCRACGFDNIDGIDRCEECMEPFRDQDIPRPKEGFQARIMQDPVCNLYSGDPASVSLGDSVLNAANLMRQWRAGCVVVVENGKPKGILSEVDLLFKCSGLNRDLAQMRVTELMTPNPQVIGEDSTIASALHLMSVGGYRHVPVVRHGILVGIVSIKDVLRYLKEHLL